MEIVEAFILKNVLHKLPEEMSHDLAIFALKHGFVPNQHKFEDEKLNVHVFGKKFSNPIGLSAGFDKNAECINSLSNQGFGFIECGTVTKMPQYGNPKPRIFRLKEDEAIINRMGFNNKGIENFIKNVVNFNSNIILGLNIGMNKNTSDVVNDYVELTERIKNLCDYVVLNISSPNTQKLKTFKQHEMLDKLLDKVKSTSKIDSDKYVPIVLKISPDITTEEKNDIANLVLHYNVDALIISNSTNLRTNELISSKKSEIGGLSGKPLFNSSTNILKDMYILTNKKIPLIASGGISNAASAYEKIKNGASLVQIYTSIIYNGFGIVNKIKKDLIQLLNQDSFSSIKDAIGKSVQD